MTDRDPTQAMDRLAEVVNERLADLGLEMHVFALVATNPNEPISRPQIQAIWIVDPERAFLSKEERDAQDIDAQFEEITRTQAALDSTEKVKDQVEEIRQRHAKKPGPPRPPRDPDAAPPTTGDLLGGFGGLH